MLRRLFRFTLCLAFLCLYGGIGSGALYAAFTGNFSQPGGAVFDGGSEDEAYGVAVDTVSVGGPYIYAVGSSSNGANGTDWLIVKYDSSGVMIASTAYDNGVEETAQSVVLDQAGDVYVVGDSYNGLSPESILFKYDSSLVFKSSAVFEGNSANLGVALDPSGNIYLVGNWFNGSSYDAIVSKYSPGLVYVSSNVFGGMLGEGLSLSTGGDVYVIGRPSSGPTSYITLKYNSSLILQSSAAFSFGTDNYPLGVAAGPNGEVYVTGMAYSGPSSIDVTVKYDSNLVLVSSAVALFGAGDNTGGSAVTVDGAGKVYVAGVSYNGTSNNVAVAKYDPNLVLLSSSSFDSGNDDRAYRVAAGIGSYVYAVGMTQDGANANFRTIRWDMPAGQTTIHMQGVDIGAWWQPALAALGKYNYVDQGTGRAGLLAIQVWTDYNFAGTLNSLRILKTGTGTGADIKSVRLFLDSDGGDPSLGDGIFSPAIDKEVTDLANPPVFDPGDPGAFVLPLYSPGVDGAVNGSTKTFFVAYEIDPDAVVGLTHGARLESSGVSLLSGVVGSFSPIISSVVPVTATADMVYLADVNKSAPNGFSAPSSLTQGDVNKPVARLTMQINGSQGSAVWRGVKLDRWVTSAENGGTAMWNKVTDVKKINVWHDSTGNGLLETTTTVKDTEVLLTSTATRTFPYDALRTPLVSTDTVLRVSNIRLFFPSDSPFPMAPGRLIVNDGQADPSLKEVVYYSTVSLADNSFGGLTRGAEDTGNTVWSSGTVVSGQAVLPFSGSGLAISTSAKDYFVTCDISPLAGVSSFSYLGLAIRSTDYFYIDSPKIMSPANIGVTAPGKTLSLIGRVREYADAVTIRATDTITGATLRQQAVNQPILAFTVQADQADALWRWLLVYATGTVVSEGTAVNDVSAVKVWQDRDNNGLLGGADVLVGSGTFGNTIYGPLLSKVSFSSEQRIMTSSEAAALGSGQRYFLTYDIRSSAMPFDSLGRARHIGAYLKAESFPQNSPSVEDATKNSISLPNSFSAASSNLSFVSRVREIVSAPGTVTVAPEPVLSPAGSGSAPAIRLAQNITTTGVLDAAWLVTSTAGIPSSGYLVVDNEIIHYAGTAAGALTAITRGALGSVKTTHSSGSVVGGMVLQGGINYPLMKMALSTPAYGVRWSKVVLSRLVQAGLTGYDADVASIKLWKDNGNGVFDRDAATGLNTSDVVIGAGKFGSPDSSGRATVYVADPALQNQDYVVVSATPTTVFVSVDIDGESLFSHEQVVPPNDVLGIEISSGGSFGFAPDNSGHSAQLLAPAIGPAGVVMPAANTVTVVPQDISPATVTQNDKNVGVLSLRMSVDKTSALVRAVSLSRLGTVSDSDIELIKIWRDSDGDCALDAADISRDGEGNYPNLLSYGNEVYSSGTASIVLRTPIVVTTVPACSFMTYDISPSAPVGAGAALYISSAGSFSVNVPNGIVMSSWPVATALMTVAELSATVMLGANDVASNLVMDGGVTQSQTKAPMLRLNLATEVGAARLSAIRLQRTGASNDPNAPFGKNTDVKFVSVYLDSNQNDMLDANDANISGPVTSLALPFASTDTVPFQLVVESTAGFPALGNLYLSEAELVAYSGGGVAASGKPYLTVTSRAGKLGNSNTPALTHPAQATVRKVDLFDQVNMLNTQAVVALSQELVISSQPKTYFVAYDIGEDAIKTNKIGITIRDKSWVIVNSPHQVANDVYIGVTKTLPRGTYTDTYPVNSSLVPVKAVILKVAGESVSPVAVEKNNQNVPMLTLSLATQSDYVNIGQVKLTQWGSIDGVAEGYGDGDLAGVALWKDDGDGAFNPLRDARLGYAIHSATNPFEGGIYVNLSDSGLPYLRVSTRPVVLHLTCDTGSGTDLFGGDILNHQAGLAISAFTDLRGPGGDALVANQYYSDSYPVSSGQVLIAAGNIPLTPVYSHVMLASNGYPAYALTDSSGNVVLGAGNLPAPDPSRWIYNYPGIPCGPSEPLIDINGDGRPDNFDYYSAGKCSNISLNNSGLPSFDLDGDQLLDIDLNLDYVPDRIVDDGAGRSLYFIGDNVQNVRLLLAVSERGAVPSGWYSKTTEIPAMWSPASASVASYELSLGGNYSDPTGIKNSWQSVGNILNGKVTAVALSPGHFTHLTSRIDINSPSFTVESAEGFAAEGIVYVGNEIILVSKLDSTTFRIIERGSQGSFIGPHTAWGETVSDRGYVVSVRGVMPDGNFIPVSNGVPLMIYRIDLTAPTIPGAPQPQVPRGAASGQAYVLRWDAATDAESNIASYEIQEREGVVSEWRTIAAIPGFKSGGAVNNIYTVGDPVNPGEAPRPLGKCYAYRTRSWNFAGAASDWSMVSSPACTSIVDTELLPVAVGSGTATGTGSILWSWNPVSGADGYVVLESTSSRLSGILSSSTFSWLETGLSTNTAYTRRIQVYNDVGYFISVVTAYTRAAVPTGLAASEVAVSSAVLSWELNGNTAGTTAQIWRSIGGNNFSSVYEGPALSFTDTGLQECSEHFFKARSRNGDGVYSGFTPTISFTAQTSTPTPPSGLYAQALEGARIALNWNFSSWPGVTVYNLYSDNATGTIDYGTPLMVFPSSTAFWITPALTSGNTYKFALRARNRCGIEEKNTTVSASAQAVGVLRGVRAAIMSPQTGKKIKGNSVTVVADIILGQYQQIKQVRFQYRLQGAAAWIDIAAANVNHPNPDTASPYFVHWDADAMAPGTYELRALATDIYNAEDPAPPTITLVIDAAAYDISESVIGGQLQQEQQVNNAVTSTVQTADAATALLTKLVLPAGAVNVATVAVTMVANPDSTPAPPEGSEDLNLTVKINLSNGQSQLSGGNTAAVTVSYKDDNNDGIVDGTNALVERLRMYTSSDGGGTWTEIPTSVDRENKTITGFTTHFSFFSVFAAPSSSLGGIKAYPVPWQPGAGGRFDAAAGITFANVPTGSRIKIFTIMGELVRQLDVAAADANNKIWDGRNTEGHKAASGVYIVLVNSGSTDRTFKIAVER